VIVLPGRVDDDLRLEFIQNRQNDVVERKQKAFIRRAGRQRNVDGCAQCVRTAEVVHESGAGIERPSVLMHGDAQNVRVVPVNILRAVAVMTIRVHDGDSLHAEFMPDVFDHDGFNVDIAESPRAVGDEHRVVAGRPDQRKGVVHLAGKNFFSGRDGAAGGNEMGVGRQILRIRNADMATVDFRVSGDAGFVFPDVGKIEQTLLKNLILRVEQPFFPLRMIDGYGPVKRREKNETCFLFFFGHEFTFPSRKRSARVLSELSRGYFFPSCRSFGSC